MTRSPHRSGRGDPFRIDENTSERLLRGSLAPEDAPPEYGRVARAFRVLNRRPTTAERVGGGTQVARLVAAIAAGGPVARPSPRHTASRSLAAAAVIVGTLSLTMGLAVAGALPDAAQRVASDVLAHVGVSAPSPGAGSAHRHGPNPPRTGSTGSGTPAASVPVTTTPSAGAPTVPTTAAGAPATGAGPAAPTGGGGSGTGGAAGGGTVTGGGPGGGPGHGNGAGQGHGGDNAGGNGHGGAAGDAGGTSHGAAGNGDGNRRP